MDAELCIYKAGKTKIGDAELRATIELGVDFIPRIGERIVYLKPANEADEMIVNGIVKSITHVYSEKNNYQRINLIYEETKD